MASTNSNNQTSPLAAAQSDLASVSRVFHRLASLQDASQFASVMYKLLPRLLKRLADNAQNKRRLGNDSALDQVYARIHTKLTEAMSHILQRVRLDGSCALPCLDLLQLLVHKPSLETTTAATDTTATATIASWTIQEYADDPTTKNLCLMFLTLGVPRSSPSDLCALLPYLLVLRGDSYHGSSSSTTTMTQTAKNQARQIAQLLLRCLVGIVVSPSTSTTTTSAATTTTMTNNDAEHLATARRLCQQDEGIASAVYSLLLDALLFTNTTPGSNTAANTTTTTTSLASSLPPPGLSAMGNETLRTGTWANDMALTGKLAQTKLALLEVIAPARRVHLLEPEAAAHDDTNGGGGRGNSRTLSLLVIASGDAHVDVADQAKLFLKMYLDAAGRKLQVTNNNNNTSSKPREDREDASSSTLTVGNSIPLALELLQLALGQSQADATVPCKEAFSLETTVAKQNNRQGDDSSTQQQQQRKLSTKRRPLDSLTAAAVVSFVPKLWKDFPDSILAATTAELEALAAMTDKLARKHLLDPTNHLTAIHNKAMVATAQLMEGMTRITMQLTATTEAQQHHNLTILTEIKDTSCRVLERVSTMGRSRTSQLLDGSLTIRDCCYLVLSHLARSSIFSGILTKNVETAKLLFTCAAKEEERLQPMAASALDALLSAYARLYNVTDAKLTSPVDVTSASDQSNPWAAEISSSTESASLGDRNPDRESLARSLLPLLWTACQAHQPKASRVAAARWAQGILLLIDLVKACHLLCFLAGDGDVTAAAIAREGLGLTRNVMDGNFGAASESGSLPDFADFVGLVFKEGNVGGQERRVQHYGDFSWQGKATALRFAMLCLMTDLYGSDDVAVALYMKTLVDTLELFQNSSGLSHGSDLMDLLDVSSGCFATLLGSSTHARTLLAKGKVGLNVADIERLVFSAKSSRARRYLAESVGEMFSDSLVWGGCSRTAEWLELTKIEDSLDTCCTEIVQMEKNHFVLGPLHGSLYLGAHLVRAIRLRAISVDSDFDERIWEKICTILSMLAKGMLRADDVVGNASADGLAVSLAYRQKDAPVLHPKLSNVLDTILLNFSEAMKTYKDGDRTDAPRITKLVEAAGVCLAATTSHDGSDGNKLGASRMKCLEGLMSLLGSGVNRKDEEIALRVGEALGLYAGCYNIQVEAADWRLGYDEELANRLAPHEHALYLLLRKQYRLSNPLHRTACAPALLGVVGLVARGVNRDPSYGDRPLVKTVLYALGEIQTVFLGLLSDPKSKHLSRESCCLGIAACHGIVKSLPASVASSDETTHSQTVRLMHAFGQSTNHFGSAYQETSQEAARRRATERSGTSNSESSQRPTTERSGGRNAEAAQRRAAERTQDPNAEQETDIMEQFGVGSETGGTANMGEAALGAYREMAEASVALGRPDVLYDLLLLSVSHAVWFTGESRERYGANALLGGELNQVKMREALKPQLGKLLPKILRASHDPNMQTREQMASLLAGLTGGGAETRQAITTHLIDTVDILLKETTSKFWRARVGACGALSEVIVGREWADLGGGGPHLEDDYWYDNLTSVAGAAVRLLRIWRAVARAVDDVREAVRVNGLLLGRAVRALTLRLCDPSLKEKTIGAKRSRDDMLNITRDASAAAGTALRWLVKHGLNQRVPESQGLCIATLVDIISVAQASILEPSLPDVIRSLLLAVSSLEPAALNYLQLRSRDQEGLERIRLHLAQSGPLAVAVQKCLDLLPAAKIETQQAVVIALDTALRLSSGFASRGAVADTCSILANTCPSAFVFSGLVGTANPSVRLMRAFYYATEKERGQGSREKMTHALGNIASFCPGSSVRSLVLKAVNHYRASTGTQNDPASRRAAASAIRNIVVRANKQLSDAGNSNVWSQKVLPVAFLGQKDEEPKVAALMKEVWDEGGSTVQESVSFGTRVEEAFLPELVKECVRALEDVSWSRRVAGSKSLAELCTLGVLSPLRVSGTESGSPPNDTLLRAKRRAQHCNIAISASARLLKKPRMWKGKSTVLEETVRLVSAWASLARAENAPSLLGLGSSEEECPWSVLSFGSAIDILEGDGSFECDKMEEEMSLEEEAPPASTTGDSPGPESNEETAEKVDFEDMEGDGVTSDSPSAQDDVANGAPEKDWATLSYPGFCRFLVDEALPASVSATLSLSEEFLPYRTAALRGFRDLLEALPETDKTIRYLIFNHVEGKLFGVVKAGGSVVDVKESKKTPPVLVAASMECIGACLWKQYPRDRAEELSAMVQLCGGKGQPAWTVREASNLALSKLVSCAEDSFLRKPSTLSGLIAAACWGAQDRKFWRVRVAALRLVQAMVHKAGSSTSQKVDIVLEALLPYKEDFQKLLRKALSDTEPKVTSLSSEVIIQMSWWP